ncbi:DUF1254 domain-containing protein [Dietzia sp. ANT_WB102]|uniref:DUF1254 domain-containing protein n=1 Tax=Dietzia sp. ANT_WB102 TaxID=2597345 RepID=UPI0011EDCFF9|nr:DUF1254 domain-containing protein [Dietzia sp. ANT_WB102]KAA0918404.1 DUF1254 domain-containing protein [Dietzia sp. ANT_WB102]
MNNVTPGFNHVIPPSIMTRDTVDTRIGRLKFFDGLPSDATVQTLYDNLDFVRAVQVFLDFVPASSMEAMRRGNKAMGVTAPHKVLIFDNPMDSSPLFLTGNTDTVYLSGILDVATEGPIVVEVPPKCGPGTVNDAFFRFVIDMGGPGPDRGQGGKYLVVPDDYDGEIPDGYFVGRTPSSSNWLILRGLLVDGRPDAAAASFREGVKIYPLAKADNPPAMEFITVSGEPFNTIHANDYAFFTEVAEVIAREPVGLLDHELRGLAASIGIRKGHPFAPDARMTAILSDAAAVGSATARAMVFKTRDAEAYLYEGSAWKAAFIGGDYQWLRDGGVGGRNLDARTSYFYLATVNTPAMALEMIGLGSQYAFITVDSNGDYLDGSKQYRLSIPADVPAKDFWSVVIYDPQTRSELQTTQPYPSKNNQRDPLAVNPDGSVDLVFGPTPPADHESNWTETVPGKGWFAIFRLYGPLQPWFDKTWRPGEVEPVK